MYIPSESVYYEIVNEEEIMSLSRDSRVFPVSPTTLYANLQTILLSSRPKRLRKIKWRLHPSGQALNKCLQLYEYYLPDIKSDWQQT
ncbi:MAG: hypothetical protein UV28_C0039G0003 [Candidatus Collierbacteria bacterium GW2011_GWE2_42_48]|nr:MAG: hypothetical protein UV28_C0039G0003 [Candidatus Collierbacteria bacterium GW2011_GWE2_42_48]